MEDDLKYLICVSSIIFIFTVFFCKSDIIEPNTDQEDTTTTDTVTSDTTDTACPDNFMCITINDYQINIDKSKIGTLGNLEDDEKTRLINDHPGLTFTPSSSRRIFKYGDTTITLSKSGNTPSFNMRTSSVQIISSSTGGSTRSSSFQSAIDSHNASGPPDGFFTTTTEEPNVQEKTTVQENDSDTFYMVGGIVFLVLCIVAGVVFYMKKEDIKGLGKATRGAVKKAKRNRTAQVDRDIE
tara:strand:+ start:738 stop:1457 length:720 start_codon:yes stop_codon:yes gene_type:complete